MECQHISKTRLGVYASLSTAKMREKHGLFLVEGLKAAKDTARHFDPVAFIITEGLDPDEDLKVFPLLSASRKEMEKISNLSTTPDFIGVFRLPEGRDEDLSVDGDSLYLLLDGVRDPGNFGTIIRTCHWFGIQKVFASRDCVDLFNPKTIQSTMGSLGAVEVVYCDLPVLIDNNPDMPVYGTLLDGENIFESGLKNHGFIVMGNEGKGISEEVKRRITHPLLIPPYRGDHSESLNVAVATGITIALFRR